MKIRAHAWPTPLGAMMAAVDEADALILLDFVDARTPEAVVGPLIGRGDALRLDAAACARVVDQVNAYFTRQLRDFELTLAPRGTPFQQQVWRQVQKIAYGHTANVTDLAVQLAQPGAFRAVGRAVAVNPIAIVVPDHRVTGPDGTFFGRTGGEERQRRLLELEGVMGAAAQLT